MSTQQANTAAFLQEFNEQERRRVEDLEAKHGGTWYDDDVYIVDHTEVVCLGAKKASPEDFEEFEARNSEATNDDMDIDSDDDYQKGVIDNRPYHLREEARQDGSKRRVKPPSRLIENM